MNLIFIKTRQLVGNKPLNFIKCIAQIYVNCGIINKPMLAAILNDETKLNNKLQVCIINTIFMNTIIININTSINI